jgi:carbon storage regulator
VLTLTRSVGETIRIGDDIEVHVVEVRGGTVRLGFKAPREVAIHREEVYRQIAEANLLAAQVTADSLGALAAFAPSVTAEATAEETAEQGAAVTAEPADDAPAEVAGTSAAATPASVRPGEGTQNQGPA